MIEDRGLITLRRPGSSVTTGGAMTQEEAAVFIAANNWRTRWRWIVEPVPSCRCCGDPAWPNLRCSKHQDRNPCLIIGCTRTAPAQGRLGVRQDVCGDHWKRYVPARSPERRAYHRFHRLAKRHGWTPELRARFVRFWSALVARIERRSTEGAIDEDQIRAMFGWDE